MPKKKSPSQAKGKGQLIQVLLILAIVFSAVSAWYATDPLWPLITLTTLVLTFVSLKKGW